LQEPETEPDAAIFQTGHAPYGCVCWCLRVLTRLGARSILPSYVYRLLTSWGAAICALPLDDY